MTQPTLASLAWERKGKVTRRERFLASLAIVLDLFSRTVVGWATASTIRRELVVHAVLMAMHQGPQFGSDAGAASVARTTSSRV